MGGGIECLPLSKIAALGSDFFDDIFWWQFLSIYILLDSFPSKAKIRLKKVLQV